MSIRTTTATLPVDMRRVDLSAYGYLVVPFLVFCPALPSTICSSVVFTFNGLLYPYRMVNVVILFAAICGILQLNGYVVDTELLVGDLSQVLEHVVRVSYL